MYFTCLTCAVHDNEVHVRTAVFRGLPGLLLTGSQSLRRPPEVMSRPNLTGARMPPCWAAVHNSKGAVRSVLTLTVTEGAMRELLPLAEEEGLGPEVKQLGPTLGYCDWQSLGRPAAVFTLHSKADTFWETARA